MRREQCGQGDPGRIALLHGSNAEASSTSRGGLERAQFALVTERKLRVGGHAGPRFFAKRSRADPCVARLSHPAKSRQPGFAGNVGCWEKALKSSLQLI